MVKVPFKAVTPAALTISISELFAGGVEVGPNWICVFVVAVNNVVALGVRISGVPIGAPGAIMPLFTRVVLKFITPMPAIAPVLITSTPRPNEPTGFVLARMPALMNVTPGPNCMLSLNDEMDATIPLLVKLPPPGRKITFPLVQVVNALVTKFAPPPIYPAFRNSISPFTTVFTSNSSHFDIEHSTNGTNYTSIGKIKAKENSPVVSSYSFVHGNPDLTGKNYYRLKQVDLDGKFTYSEIRSVRFNEGKAAVIVALPNPVKDILQVAVQADDVSIHISDMNGRIYRRLNLRAGNHQVNVSNLPTGNYSIVVYQKNKRVAVQQLIKQ